MTFRAAATKRSTVITNIYAGQAGKVPLVGDIGTIWFTSEDQPVPAKCIKRNAEQYTYDITTEVGK